MKPIYEDEWVGVYPVDADDCVAVLFKATYNKIYFERRIVKAMAEAYGLIPEMPFDLDKDRKPEDYNI